MWIFFSRNPQTIHSRPAESAHSMRPFKPSSLSLPPVYGTLLPPVTRCPLRRKCVEYLAGWRELFEFLQYLAHFFPAVFRSSGLQTRVVRFKNAEKERMEREARKECRFASSPSRWPILLRGRKTLALFLANIEQSDRISSTRRRDQDATVYLFQDFSKKRKVLSEKGRLFPLGNSVLKWEKAP